MSTEGIPLPEILEAIDVARERGWTVQSGVWIDRLDGVNCCCPLGACLIQRDMNQGPIEDDEADSGFVSEKLGLHRAWVEGFADGFDGRPVRPCLSASFRRPDIYERGHQAGSTISAELSDADLVDWGVNP